MQRPESAAEMLLNEYFTGSCKNHFSIPIKAVRTEGVRFQLASINIEDPLNAANNLGIFTCLGMSLLQNSLLSEQPLCTKLRAHLLVVIVKRFEYMCGNFL